MRFQLCFSALVLGLAANALAADKNDVKEKIVGKWVSQDKHKNPVEFAKDGKAKIGFIIENGKWIIVDGTWSIADDGRIITKGSHGGATFSNWYRYKDGNLVGPMGPNPQATWAKVKDEKKE